MEDGCWWAGVVIKGRCRGRRAATHTARMNSAARRDAVEVAGALVPMGARAFLLRYIHRFSRFGGVGIGFAKVIVKKEVRKGFRKIKFLSPSLGRPQSTAASLLGCLGSR